MVQIHGCLRKVFKKILPFSDTFCVLKRYFFTFKHKNLYIFMDVPKKRIPRAEFHGIILNFVECGKCKIAHKVESPYFCLKSGIST